MKTNKYSGTKTEQNLRTAFSGESEARNKYTFFASTAKKEGYERKGARQDVVQRAPGHRLHRRQSALRR